MGTVEVGPVIGILAGGRRTLSACPLNRFNQGWHFKPKNRKNQPTIYRKTAIAITLVLKQHNGVLQIHSPPTLEFVTLVVNLYFCECLKTCGFKPLIRGNRPHCGCGKPQNAVGLRFQKSPNRK
ncbi:unnamed protein product [Prunus armeniaca]